ncbi:MAG: hypothetical protein ACRC9V_06050 [Aeromonas sp.]
MKRYDLELTATGPVMEEREKGAFVQFSEVSGLAEQLADATRQCGVMAELLREVTKIVPAIGVAIDDLPVVDAFLERVEMVLAGQVLEPARNEALAMMMDELHDICVGLDAPGGAQNGAEAWDQVNGARDRVLSSLNQGRPDTEWTDATTSPVAADYRELQEQHDQLQSKHKGALDLLQEAHEVMCRIIPTLPQDCANRSDLLDRIEVALAGKQQNKPVTITETIRTAPERIWLQVGDQSHYHSEPFPEHNDEVSWCSDSVVACEVPYVRADLAGHVVSQPLRLLIQMTDILKMCRSALITAYEDILDGTAKGVIQYRIKLATKGINMAEHAIDAAAQTNSGRFITDGQELELITVLQSIVNGFSDDPAHDAAALLKRITGEVPWAGDSFQLPPRQGGEPCDSASPSSSQA